ncbi:MAG: protein translocase subunit SecD, partial [Alphaproteobacteria bacterium]|nr:protein translocase subunit SecD [Alphaproteobacteria bacterium]
MLRFSTWKFFAIVAMTLAAVLIVAPSMLSASHYEELKSRLPSWLVPPTIVLGLDLQGGSHVMLG